MIFVQIASYRDPELIPTVLDLIAKSDSPDQLRIVVAWQHDDYESVDLIKKYIEVIDIPYVDSKGVCWARNLIQQYYNGEQYTLQLDSHHRFVQGWDTKCIEIYNNAKKLGSKLPLITGYLPNFDSINNTFTDEIWAIKLVKFMPDGPLFCSPVPILDEQYLNTPYPARFYSGHFAFTDGNFCKLVPHDPDYYFYGEETNIAVRAFTHGYDLYHPNTKIGYHQYNRNYRPTHWGDHVNTLKKVTDTEWHLLDKNSTDKHRGLFGINQPMMRVENCYGFGAVRTLSEYEQYAGIRFSDRYISQYTLNNGVPPSPIE